MPKDRLEGDKVVVTRNPEYTDRSNEQMAEEIRDASEVSSYEFRDPEPGEAMAHRRSETSSTLWNSRPLLGITAGLLLILAFIAALSTDSWWVVGIGIVLVVAVWGAWTVLIGGGLMAEQEKPDPGRVADLEEAGVLDPEGELNERVAALDSEHGRATRGQTEGWTPASGDNPDITTKDEVDAAQQSPAARAEKRLGRRPSE